LWQCATRYTRKTPDLTSRNAGVWAAPPTKEADQGQQPVPLDAVSGLYVMALEAIGDSKKFLPLGRYVTGRRDESMKVALIKKS